MSREVALAYEIGPVTGEILTLQTTAVSQGVPRRAQDIEVFIDAIANLSAPDLTIDVSLRGTPDPNVGGWLRYDSMDVGLGPDGKGVRIRLVANACALGPCLASGPYAVQVTAQVNLGVEGFGESAAYTVPVTLVVDR